MVPALVKLCATVNVAPPTLLSDCTRRVAPAALLKAPLRVLVPGRIVKVPWLTRVALAASPPPVSVTAAVLERVPELSVTPLRTTAPVIEPESGVNAPPPIDSTWPEATVIAPLLVKLGAVPDWV